MLKILVVVGWERGVRGERKTAARNKAGDRRGSGSVRNGFDQGDGNKKAAAPHGAHGWFILGSYT
jgi:hypothetical protein